MNFIAAQGASTSDVAQGASTSDAAQGALADDCILKILGSFKEKGVSIPAFKGTCIAIYGIPVNFEDVLRLVLKGYIKIDLEAELISVANDYYHKFNLELLSIMDYN